METETQRLIDDLAIARDTRDRAQAEATRQTLRARELDRQLSGLLSEHLSVTLIAEERRRQVEQEGWTPEHDDTLAGGELALAAACYAVNDQPRIAADVFRCWPWQRAWFKPKGQVRNLVKAGALIAAEIDRRLRGGKMQASDREYVARARSLPPAGDLKPVVKLDSYYEWCIEKARERQDRSLGVGSDMSIVLTALDSILKQCHVEVTEHEGCTYRQATKVLREAREADELLAPVGMAPEQCEEAIVVKEVTAVCRAADKHFEKVGGGTRHWVRECFIPALNKAGWLLRKV